MLNSICHFKVDEHVPRGWPNELRVYHCISRTRSLRSGRAFSDVPRFITESHETAADPLSS